VNISSNGCEQPLKGAIAAAQANDNGEGSMPASNLRAVPDNAEIDSATDLDQLSRMTSALMSALLLGSLSAKEGSAKLGRIDKRMNTLEREIGRGVNNAA
jgi:hypothetical protein